MDDLHGVRFTPLMMHRDDRGTFTEIFRDEWDSGVRPCQWNATMSRPNVLRGVHVHRKHHDYLVVVSGRMSVGLFDMRRASPTRGSSRLIQFSGERLTGVSIPAGVAHGFYAHEPTLHIYGVDAYYDPSDELGCHWADPRLGIDWPCDDPELSERDRRAGSLAELEARFHAAFVELT